MLIIKKYNKGLPEKHFFKDYFFTNIKKLKFDDKSNYLVIGR
jgi:hypothetical protein